ncbi:MAG TPA: cyclic pyranopterin monophosphate synthase MoaC [Candidatus Limnocylindrales bacterium]|nr:cyclic pyranopterin monophosphate synthase MoaC [Candidatus Limnocylindrales bacterium]
MNPLTHFDDQGQAHMVDVSDKASTRREAVAQGVVYMKPETFRMIVNQKIAKGDVFGVARIAGIMAAKKTSELIPLCHPLAITGIDIFFNPVEAESKIEIRAEVRITDKTGVEMEALTAVSIAALTIYDMCKAVDRGMRISDIHLVKKTGGKSGTFIA